MKIVYAAYREWALDVWPVINNHPKVNRAIICKTNEELQKVDLANYDLLITCGWSEELGDQVTSKIAAIGVHCAELDRYSYGTPIQLQIIDGINRTKHRVFSFTFETESPRAHTHNRLYSHEIDLDLSGNMTDILHQLTATSRVLFTRYLDDYPDIQWKQWPEEPVVRKKRVPLDSRLTKEEINRMSTIELYNFFRSLESPYPNGFIEDDVGRLYIESVKFKYK